MGVAHPRILLAQLTSRELSEWAAYFRLQDGPPTGTASPPQEPREGPAAGPWRGLPGMTAEQMQNVLAAAAKIAPKPDPRLVR